MPTKLETLDTDNWESMHRLCRHMYLDGQCYEFAIALHRDLGRPLVGLMQGDVIRHALVKVKAGNRELFWDVRGSVTKAETGEPFDIAKPYVLQPISEKDLQDTRPVYEESIDRASLFAQALWPKLPWHRKTFQKKTLSFMDDLEKLCRKHRVWIRAPFPAARIVLGQMYGDEKGFIVSPSMDGQYFFDRVI